MVRRGLSMRLGVLRVAVGLTCTATPARAQDASAVRFHNPVQAAAAIVLLNALPWSYDRYVQHWDFAQVSASTWWHNVRTGFRWDDDVLTDNQLAHPLHGALYFNSARGAGYSFWGSMPFVALGSLTWEFLAENLPASPNDVINTTLGGAALGEATSRLARLLAHQGMDRGLGRRMAAVAIDPLGHIQSWTSSQRRVGSPVMQPENASHSLALGVDHQWSTNARSTAGSARFVGLSVGYGDPFAAGTFGPYDAFEFTLELAQRGTWTVQRLAVDGLLARSTVRRTARGDFAFGLIQHYEFLDSPMVLSCQSVAGALLYQSAGGGLSGELQLEGVILGEVESDYNAVRGRNYDYAPGLGLRLGTAIHRGSWQLLGLHSRATWLRSVYGTDGYHLTMVSRLSSTVPITSTLALGGETVVTWRRSAYQGMHVSRSVPELRVFLTWAAH